MAAPLAVVSVTNYPWWVNGFMLIGIIVTLAWVLIMGLILWDEFNWHVRRRP